MATLFLVAGVLTLFAYVLWVTMVQTVQKPIHTYVVILSLSLTGISAALALFDPANWTVGH
jgi:hypothetical protein